MPDVSKVVRFYRPVMIDRDESRKNLSNDFWKQLRSHVETLGPSDRRAVQAGVQYRGDTGVGVSPALPYLRVGRVRAPIDWPDTVDSSDAVAPLRLNGRNLLENAYIVPFGASNQIALMNPIRGLVPLSAVETWLGSVLSLPQKGQSIELMPEIDAKALSKLANSTSVAKLIVRIPYDEELEMPAGSNSQVERAVRMADSAAGGELDVEIAFSHGRRTPRGMGDTLKGVAQRLARSAGLSELKVSLVLQDGDGFRREQHDLLRDQIAETARFSRPESRQLTVDEILEAMAGAIAEFRKR